jgi:Aminotransferase class-III
MSHTTTLPTWNNSSKRLSPTNQRKANKDWQPSCSKHCKEKVVSNLAILDSLPRHENYVTNTEQVQVGMGRSGTLWGYENLNVIPDVFTSAKALGGGVPIGAMMARGVSLVLVTMLQPMEETHWRVLRESL